MKQSGMKVNKYRCISNIEKEGRIVAKEGDIIVTDGNSFYNITTGKDYKNITFDEAVGSLVSITDDPVSTITSDADRFKAITTQMCDTFRRKNHDYGNSFEQSLNEEGLSAMRIRGGDKWLRFKNLSKSTNPLVEDESIRDTLLDLSNYCIMTVMWMDKYGNIKNL